MSLNRLIFYSAMIGGWAAFVGWLLSETFLLQRSTDAGVVAVLITTALVGALIAGGLALLGGVASGSLQGQWHRLVPGLAGGFLAGAVGGLVGNLFYLFFRNVMGATAAWSVIGPMIRIFGWTLMGLAIGAVEGLYDRSFKKVRNGLIGGGIGGFLGGLFFAPVASLVGEGGMSSRAAAFVILGMSIGCFVGLAQVILKEAWLTVEAGFRPGRQLVLNVPEIILGTSEKAALPFIAFGAKGVEPIHLRITRRDDGTYLLQDNHSRTGTFVNRQPVQGAVVLSNDDVIQLGVNVVRFREVHKHVSAAAAPAPAIMAPARPGRLATDAVAAGPAPAARAPMPQAAALPGRPKPPAAVPMPNPIAAGPPVSKAPLPPSSTGGKPRPPARPAPPVPAAPPPPAAATSPGGQGCPICGRAGAAVPHSSKRRCVSCGINF